MSQFRLALDLLRVEGPRGLLERLADRTAERRRQAGGREVALSEVGPDGEPPIALDVLATPLAPRFGGVTAQLSARREEERRLWPTALLSPEAGSWTLRVERGEERLRTRLGPVTAVPGPAGSPLLEAGPVIEAASAVGASVVNVEGVAGRAPRSLLALAGREPRLVLSIHDFALFCPRPNLVEEPAKRFCGYSRDAARCRACLAATAIAAGGTVERWREEASDLLSRADAVVYPSEFLRRGHAELFPEARRRRERVIAPAAPGGAGLASGEARPPRTKGMPLHVAFVGAYRPHKGALVFEEMLRRSGGEAGPLLRWSILGSGDPELLLRARRLGAAVAGHYRSGGLPRLLLRRKVDVAVLPSIAPESWSLTLGECREAGVSVVAFRLGAIAERVEEEGGGVLVPAESGPAGLLGTLLEVANGACPVPPFRGATRDGSAAAAAAERADLYRRLLAEPR